MKQKENLAQKMVMYTIKQKQNKTKKKNVAQKLVEHIKQKENLAQKFLSNLTSFVLSSKHQIL